MTCWGYPENQHHKLERIIGWGEKQKARGNRLTRAGYTSNHRRFPEHGPDCDDLLAWLRDRWLVEIYTHGLPATTTQVRCRDLTQPHDTHYLTGHHATLIEALATAVLFLGTELEGCA